MSQAQNGGVSRRRFLQGVGGAAGAAAIATSGIGTAGAIDLSWEEASAGATVTGGGTYGVYLAQEAVEAIDGQSFPSGSSTPEAMAESWYRTGKYAQSADETMLSTLWNRLEDATTIAAVLYKAKAIEAIKAGKSESEVLTAAQNAVSKYYAETVQTNFINHWNVQASKLEAAYKEFDQHDGVSDPTDFARIKHDIIAYDEDNSNSPLTGRWNGSVALEPVDVTLLNGSTVSVSQIQANSSSSVHWAGVNMDFNTSTTIDLRGPNPSVSGSSQFDSIEYEEIWANWNIPANKLDGVEAGKNVNWWVYYPGEGPETYAEAETAIEENGEEWGNFRTLNQYMILWDGIVQQHQMMLDNAEKWVSNAYGAVQAGEIDVQDLIENNPTVMAAQWSSEYQSTGHLAYAAADLAALGLSFDSENRMRFQLDDGTTFEGTLYCSNSDFEIEVGTVISPSERAGDYYAAADTESMERQLPSEDYRDSIDGGQIKLNVGVITDLEYVVETNRGETVTIAWDDWSIAEPSDATIIEDATAVTYDASGDLEESVAEVASVTLRYQGDESATVMQLTAPFTILEAYDVESGEEVETVAGEGYNPTSSTVDLSWIENYLERREDIDNYATSGGGGGGGGISWNGFDWSWLPGMGRDGWLTGSTMGVPNWLILATGGIALVVALR
ncbi:hypothetical protein [Salinarchaeum laminariae]|uniref:hypothetical protein n=1 Tax=Salinarchaeum laminariae TaxID=869888 RepID=UPI0020BF50D5|nr:hypothetical protein [Salinarchaeum laminariae]